MLFLSSQSSFHENAKCDVSNEILSLRGLSNTSKLSKTITNRGLRAVASGQYYHRKALTDTTEAKVYSGFIGKTLVKYNILSV